MSILKSADLNSNIREYYWFYDGDDSGNSGNGDRNDVGDVISGD